MKREKKGRGLLIAGIVLFILPILTWFSLGFVEAAGTTIIFWVVGIPMIITGADRMTPGGIWTTKKKPIPESEKHWSMVSEYDKNGKKVGQTLTVRCPNCNSKVSSEYVKCRECGYEDAAWFSLGCCEYVLQEIKSLRINTRKHSSEEHDVKSIVSPTEAAIRHGMDLYDTIMFQQGIAKGARGQYFEISDFRIGKYASGTAFRPEYLLKCLLCHKTFWAYSDPRLLYDHFSSTLDLECLY